MIQRVLVPTDFSVKSLRIVLEYLENSGDDQMELVFTCGYRIEDSISSLLGFTLDDHLADMQSDDFLKGCEMIKSRFKHQIVEMYSDLIISKNKRYIRNYLKGRKITHIVIPNAFEFEYTRSSFDIIEVLKTTELNNLPVVTAVCISDNSLSGQDALDSFFFRKKWRFIYE